MLTLYNKEHIKLKFLKTRKEYSIKSTLLTGDRKLSFLLPKHEYIENEMYVRAQGQEYVVKSISPSSMSWLKIECDLNVEELEGKPLDTFETVEKTIKECLDFAFVGTGWIVGSSTITKRRTIKKTKTTVWSILQDIRKTYHAEIEIDSIKKIVHIYDRIGADKGAYFIDGLNIQKLTKQVSSYDFYTQIRPRGKDDLNISSVNGGSEIISDFSFSSKEKLFLWTDQRYTNAQSLMNDALLKLREMSKPLVALSLDVIDLSKVDKRYSILDYALGDTIQVISKEEKINEKTRIVSLIEYPDEPIKNKIEIANSLLKFEDLQEEFQEASKTVSNITSDNGTVDGSTINGIKSNQISDFSVKVAQVVNLSAMNATIQNLISDKASVQQLNAVSAKVGALEATSISATQFNAKIAEIDTAMISKASIVDLSVATAKISILEANVGTIGTLISGSVSAGSTQTIVLNAKNTTIENALIKSAMIDSLVASKITAGIIDASSIHFKSKTGNMDIYDNTISIRDANRVRVQIGKDASNDYNMYVWDNVGKLMFDATGLKADGIKSKIIRDDMVSDSANINGSKIDIASVVTEINNGTSNIKSSHILYDPTGQTLNVAFNSLSTKLDNIDIGERNLYKVTRDFKDTTSFTLGLGSGSSGTIEASNGAMVINKITQGAYFYLVKTRCTIPRYEAGKQYTLTLRLKSTFDGAIANASIRYGNGLECAGVFGDFKCTTEYQTISKTMLAIEGKSIELFLSFNSIAKYYIEWIKVTEGNMASDWSPAPEEVEDKIVALSTSLTVEQGKISGLLAESTQIKGDISSLNTKYTSIDATVKGLNVKVGEQTTSISTVTNTVSANKANWDKAGSALATAESAKNSIDGLQVGGGNLLLNSTGLMGTKYWTGGNGLTQFKATTYADRPTQAKYAFELFSDKIAEGYVYSTRFLLKSNTEYTVSGYYNIDSKQGVIIKGIDVWLLTSDTLLVEDTSSISFDNTHLIVNGNTLFQWIKFSKTIKTGTTTQSGIIRLDHNGHEASGTETRVLFADLVVNEGNKPIAWCKSYKDTENLIISEIKTVTDKQASFDVTLDGIKGRVSSTESKITTVTEAVNGLQVGGRNLLLNSGNAITNNKYEIKSYTLGNEKPKEGDTCTVTVKASLGMGKKSLSIFNSGGMVKLYEILPTYFVNGIASKSFKWKIVNGPYTASNQNITLYTMNSDVVVDSTISWIRLDFGNKAPQIWSPAPEDTESLITTEIKTVTDKQASLDVTLDGISSRVSSTETKVTTVTEGLANLQIGTRNLARGTGIAKTFNGFTGVANTVSNFYNVWLSSDLAVGDKVTLSFDYEYTNLVGVASKTPVGRTQGSGNVTAWGNGEFPVAISLPVGGTGKIRCIKTATINAEHIKNAYWTAGVRFDWVQSGTVTFSNFKFERGDKATSWSPAPEDIDARITNEIKTVTDKQASFDTTIEGIKGQVSSTETKVTTVTEGLANLQIGSSNILRKSGQFTDIESLKGIWSSGGGGLSISSTVQYLGHNTIQSNVGGGIYGQWYKLETNIEYTYAIMIQSTKSFTGTDFSPLHYWTGIDNVQGGSLVVVKRDNSYTTPNSWKLLYLTFKLIGNVNSFKPFIYAQGNQDFGVFNIAFMTLTKGNKPLIDWSPAPEEMSQSITETSTKLADLILDTNKFKVSVSETYTTKDTLKGYSTTTQMQSAITAKADLINIEVAKKTDKTSIIAAINVTPEVIKISASKLELTGAVTISMLDNALKGTINTAKDDSYKAFIMARAMAQGRMLYTDPTFLRGINGIKVYNGASNTNVSIARAERHAAISDCPSPYYVEIQSKGVATPGWGGFYFGNQSSANHTYVYKVVAKIPTDRYISWGSNAYGDDGTMVWITGQEGTGNFEEYICVLKAGTKGTFSTTGFFYLAGGTTAKYWWLGYATCWDLNTEPLENEWTQGTTKINGGFIQTGTITAEHISSNTLYGTTIVGGTISSNSTISVSTNLKVGDNIYLGDQNTFGIKRIHLNSSNYISFQNALSFSSGGRLLWYEGQDGSSMAFRPAEASRDIFHLGTNYARWRDVYAVRGSIDTSDRNKKHDICPIDDKYKKLFMDLKPVSYKFNDNKHNRIHTGFVSQDVETSLNKFGMDGLDFAGFCKEQAVTVTTDKDGGETMTPKIENGEPVYDYSLRYTEFISLNTAMIQDTIKSVSSLQGYVDNELLIANVQQKQGLYELAKKHKVDIQKLKKDLEDEINELKDKIKLLEEN